MKDLKAKTVRGGFAKMCSQAASLTLRVGSLMILARLLDPHDFGLVAMVTAVTGALSLFRDFGLSAATVQRTSITQEQLSILFWINVLVGSMLTAIALVGAPVVAVFYHEPRLFWITITVATVFVINGAGVQHSALLQREMRFTTLAVIEVISLLAGVVVAIGMALFGFGYWALVAMTVVMPLAYAISVWLASAWIPGLPRRRMEIGSMLRFGGTITLNSVIMYVAYNLEKVLLGRIWGADALGIYGRAYQLVNIPTESLNGAVGEVAFSALSRIRHDPARLKIYFLKGYSLVVALTLPITIACALLADDIIFVVLGPKWSETTPIFRLLAPTILVFAMINPTWWLLVSLGLVGRSLRIALVLAPLVIVGYLAGLPYGPTGVALGFSTVMTLWVIPHLVWAIHGTVVSLKDIVWAIGRPLLSAIVAAALAAGAVSFVPESFPHLWRLLLGATVLLLAYIGMLFFVMRQKAFYLDLARVLVNRPAPGEGKFPA